MSTKYPFIIEELSTYCLPLMEISPCVFWIHSLDYQKLIYVNAAFESSWDMNRETFYANPHCWLERVHIDDKYKLHKQIAKRSKFVGTHRSFTDRYRLMNDEGIRWMEHKSFVLYSPDKEAIGIGSVCIDITNEMRCEIDFTDPLNIPRPVNVESKPSTRVPISRFPMISREVFIQLAEKSQDVFWVRSADYATQLYVSPAFENIWGRSCEELYKNPDSWGSSLHPDDAIFIKTLITQRNSNSDNYADPDIPPFRIVRPDGSIRWIKDKSFSVENEQGKILAHTGVAQDVTHEILVKSALEHAKRLAEEANQSKSEFLANVSHELRTPLNGILGMAQILQTQDLNEEQSASVKAIYNSGHHLLLLIDDILDFAKLEAAQIELDDTSFDLGLLIAEVVSGFSVQASNKKIAMITDYDRSIPKVVIGDPKRIRQIITNLLSNAIKFTDHGHVLIAVELLEVNEHTIKLQILVEDSGCGVPSGEVDLIFDRFKQVESKQVKKAQGVGLGLSITKQLVDLMGGEIGVHSQIGHGSTFWCQFEFGMVFQEEHFPKELDSLNGLRALIVDDKLLRGKVVSKYLSMCDVTQKTSLEVIEAYQDCQAEEGYFDLILLEQECNHDTLVSLLDLIQLNPNLNQALTILLKTSDQPTLKHPCLYATINTPVHPATFLTKVSEMWKRWSELASVSTVPFEQSYILLVEDNPLNQMVQQKLLEALGCQVDVVGTGKEAIKVVSTNTYDAILMDVSLPDMTGLDVTDVIRSGQTHNCDKPIIALTAHILDSDRQLYKKHGMNDLITKPVLQGQLESVLYRWLEKVPA